MSLPDDIKDLASLQRMEMGLVPDEVTLAEQAAAFDRLLDDIFPDGES